MKTYQTRIHTMELGDTLNGFYEIHSVDYRSSRLDKWNADLATKHYAVALKRVKEIQLMEVS